MSVHAGIKPLTGRAPKSQQDTNGQPSGRVAAKAGIVWEDPYALPSRGKGGQPGRWFVILQPLMERPGFWARIKDFAAIAAASTCAHNLNRRMLNYPAGRWRFIARTVDGVGVLYGRYLGPEAGQ